MEKDRSRNDEVPDGNGSEQEPTKTGTVPRSARTRGTVPVFASCPSEDRAAERSRRAIERWKAKCTPERVTAVLAAKAESMRERYEVQAVMLCQVEKSVAEITDAAGVPRMMRIWYMDFGRQVYRIWRKVPSSVREMECGFVRLKWQTRGLDPAILDKVKEAIVAMLDSLD